MDIFWNHLEERFYGSLKFLKDLYGWVASLSTHTNPLTFSNLQTAIKKSHA